MFLISYLDDYKHVSLFHVTFTIMLVRKNSVSEQELLPELQVFPYCRPLRLTKHWPQWGVVSPFFSLSKGTPKDQALLICQPANLLSEALGLFIISFPGKGEQGGGGHFSWMPLPWSERENASQIERERERESTDYQWEPLSGRQHKLVWGKFKNRRQQAETVSPLCSFDLPLTWVHLKPGRDTSTAVWCVLRHWAAKTARCASRCNLI